jgi:hypothetical protein
MSPRVYSKRNQASAKTRALDSWDGWGWSVFFGQLIIAFGFLIFGLTHFAFGSREMGSEHMFSNQINSSSRAQVRGEIGWNNGVGTLRDHSSGRVYTLVHSDGVKALWEAGVRNVSVVGRMGNDNTFTVENISAP